MSVIRTGQKVRLSGAPKNQVNNNLPYEAGSAVWESTNPAALTVKVRDENELEAEVECVDDSGGGVATVSCILEGLANGGRRLVGTKTFVLSQEDVYHTELKGGESGNAHGIVQRDKGFRYDETGAPLPVQQETMPQLPPPVLGRGANFSTAGEGNAQTNFPPAEEPDVETPLEQLQDANQREGGSTPPFKAGRGGDAGKGNQPAKVGGAGDEFDTTPAVTT